MNAISDIIKFLGWLQEALYKAYVEILDLPWPFWLAAWPFYLAADAVNRLAWAFFDFYYWVEEIEDSIKHIATPEELFFLISSMFPELGQIRQWLLNWVWKVEEVIGNWWTSISSIILGWIDAAKAWAWLWIDYLDIEVNKLKVRLDNLVIEFPDVSGVLSWFTNWPGELLSVVNTWWTGVLPEVQGLITSNLKTWFPFYDDLVSLWSDIKEFFTDPEDWLYKSLDRIVERFW